VRVPAAPNSKAASMYEDKDRQLRVGINSSILVGRHRDVEVQTFEVGMRRNLWEWQGVLDEAEFAFDGTDWRYWRGTDTLVYGDWHHQLTYPNLVASVVPDP